MLYNYNEIGIVFQIEEINMNRTRIKLLIFAAFSVLFLSGCVNLVQEMTIQEDGSGTLLFAMGVETAAYDEFQSAIPAGFEFENLFLTLIQDENVTSVIQNHFEADGSTWDSIQLDMADFAAIFEQDRRVGPLTLSVDEQDGTYTFEQWMDLSSSNVNIPGVNLLDLTGTGYTVRLITPQIVGTNGVQQEAGISTWTVSLTDLLQGGGSIFLRAAYILEPYEGVFIPWEVYFPYIVIGFLTLGGLAILGVIIVNTTGKREKVRKMKF